MNSLSSGMWDIPPPPGTEDDQVVKSELDSPKKSDKLDICLKSSEHSEYAKKSSRLKGRSRSKSYDRYEKRRRSRSRSKSRYLSRRSRSSSRSRSHRRKKYSRSRSRSSSLNRLKHRRERDKRSRRYSRSRNTSRSRNSSRSRYNSHSRYSKSRSRSKSKSYKSHRSSRHRRNSKEKSDYDVKRTVENSDELIDVKVEEEEEEEESEPVKDNAFKNDGSFLEMFKKMQEEKKAQEEAQKAEAEKQKLLPSFGKRRGGRVLKTGMVQKAKTQDNEENVHDPWSVYMKEVKKYKEACCDDDSKTRLLVK